MKKVYFKSNGVLSEEVDVEFASDVVDDGVYDLIGWSLQQADQEAAEKMFEYMSGRDFSILDALRYFLRISKNDLVIDLG